MYIFIERSPFCSDGMYIIDDAFSFAKCWKIDCNFRIWHPCCYCIEIQIGRLGKHSTLLEPRSWREGCVYIIPWKHTLVLRIPLGSQITLFNRMCKQAWWNTMKTTVGHDNIQTWQEIFAWGYLRRNAIASRLRILCRVIIRHCPESNIQVLQWLLSNYSFGVYRVLETTIGFFTRFVHLGDSEHMWQCWECTMRANTIVTLQKCWSSFEMSVASLIFYRNPLTSTNKYKIINMTLDNTISAFKKGSFVILLKAISRIQMATSFSLRNIAFSEQNLLVVDPCQWYTRSPSGLISTFMDIFVMSCWVVIGFNTSKVIRCMLLDTSSSTQYGVKYMLYT